jgi:hypothetical protein
MIPRVYVEIFVVAIACVVAVYAGAHLVQLPAPLLAVATALVLVLLWILTARDYWWTLLLAGASVTGVFWIGFKIYPTEAAIALCLLALAPMLLLRGERIFQSHRRPLPFLFYVAAVYITVRMSIDIAPAQGARGNLGRIYFDAVWPFFFSWVFYRYGKTSVVWTALVLAFVMLAVRAGCATVGYIYDIPLYIPGINYILSFSGTDSLTSMRSVAYNLLFLSLIFLHAFRSLLGKFLMLPVMAGASVLIVMGGSRFMTLLYLVLPICFFAWTRRWLFCVFALGLGVAVVTTVNLEPRLLDSLPDSVSRSFAGLVVRPVNDVAPLDTASSNEWHSSLRQEGYDRWTQSPLTFLFGYGIRPSPDYAETMQYSLDAKTVVGLAANLGAYESALWTVLGVLGTAGFLLYAFLYFQFWQRLWPYFWQRPRGTIAEGMLFWAVYSSFLWFATGYFQGGFPGFDIFLLVMAWALVEDGRLPLEKTENEDEFLLDLGQEPAG